MRYMILGAIALACEVVASLPAQAADLDYCDKPVSHLTVQQIDNCRKLLDYNKLFQSFDEAFIAKQRKEDAALDLARTVLGPEAVRDPRPLRDRSR